MKPSARHCLADFSNCEFELLNDIQAIEKMLQESATIAGATIVKSFFHHFSPWGVSGVVIIQESHITIHTWPEHKFAAVDFFSCGDDVDPIKAIEYIKTYLKADYTLRDLVRG